MEYRIDTYGKMVYLPYSLGARIEEGQDFPGFPDDVRRRSLELQQRGRGGAGGSITVETPMVKTRKLEELETSIEARRGDLLAPIVAVSPQTGTRYLFPPLDKIIESSVFGRNDRRVSKGLRVKGVSCNPRVVIAAQ